jgi:choline kinase
MTRSTAKLKNEHEDLTQQLMYLEKIHAARFKDLLFMEVDTPADYQKMRNDIYPNIKSV